MSTSTEAKSVYVNLNIDELRLVINGLYKLMTLKDPYLLIEDRRLAMQLVQSLQEEHKELAKVSGSSN